MPNVWLGSKADIPRIGPNYDVSARSEVGDRTPKILDEGANRLFREIVGSQHHGSVGLGLLFEELTRCSLFNCFTQSHKLIYTLIWLRVTPTFKIVQRRSADRAQNYLALIEHCELNDHSIELIAMHLASRSGIANSPCWREFIRR
jgi:hypothetical protein